MAVSDIDRGQVLAARRDPLRQRGSLLDRQKGIDENSQSRRPDRRGGPGTQRCPLDRGAPTNRRSQPPHFDNCPEQRSCTFSLASIPAVIDPSGRIPRRNPPNRQLFLSGLTLAIAPRSSPRNNSANGNCFLLQLITPSGSLALVSSFSNANK